MPSGTEGKRWRVGDIELLTAGSTMPIKQFLYYDVISHAAAGPIIEQWLRRSEYRSTLIDVCRTLGLQHTPSFSESAERLIAADIQRAFKAGDLYLLRRRSGAAAQQAIQPVETKKNQGPRALPVQTKTWIEIHLVDQDDQPVGNRQYRLKITDGSVRTGTLGSDGVLRVNGIDPGTCELSFLDIDANEWRPA